MSRTKNKWVRSITYKGKRKRKRSISGKLRGISKSVLYYIYPTWYNSRKCDSDTPDYKYGKPRRVGQTNNLKEERRLLNKRLRRYLKNDAIREIQEELKE